MKEFLEIFRNPELFELFKGRPGWFIAFTCVLAFLLRSKIIFEFLYSLRGFFNKVSQRKDLKFKARHADLHAIYENPQASKEIKNSAKGELEALDFEKMHGIKTSPELISPLFKLITESQNPRQTRFDIRRSISFLEKGCDDLLQFRSEKKEEKYWRYFCNFYGSFFLLLCLSVLFIVCFCVLQSVEIKIFMWILFLFLFCLSLIFFSQAAYIHSFKRIQKEIALINNNKNLNKKSKLRFWFNNLRRKLK
jgi:ABC-type multidrug transport system fused ATPase/permease subunit